MTADVNVPEKAIEVQRRERGEAWGALVPEEGWTVGRIVEDAIETTLDTLADPEVLDGIAGVLAEHGDSRQSAGGFLLVCRCGEAVDEHAAHQAAAVVEWLRGQA